MQTIDDPLAPMCRAHDEETGESGAIVLIFAAMPRPRCGGLARSAASEPGGKVISLFEASRRGDRMLRLVETPGAPR